MAIETGWFKKRLTKSKSESILYSGLADIIEQMVIYAVEPLLTRISNRKSFFTMDSEDLDTRIAEMGQFFTIRSSDASSKPILLQQRQDEIHFKGTDRPITQTFYREFKGIPITWQPLYAPVNTEKYPYGTVLIAANNISSVGDFYGELWMTSRGAVSIPLNELMSLIGSDEQFNDKTVAEITDEALTKFNQVVKPLLPLYIVFDGMQMLAEFDVTERSDYARLISVNSSSAIFVTSENTDRASCLIYTEQQLPTAIPATGREHGPVRYDTTPHDGSVLDAITYPAFDDSIDIFLSTHDAVDSPSFVSASADATFSTIISDAVDSVIEQNIQYGFVGTASAAPDIGSEFITRFDNTPHDTSVDYDFEETDS